MPHPRRLPSPKIPRFSSIVRSDEAPALQSPHAHENAPLNALPAPNQQPFNPKVAAYTLAFVSVLIGGLYIGAQSKTFMQNWEVCTLVICILTEATKEIQKSVDGGQNCRVPVPCFKVNASLRKLRETLLQQRERLEDQIAITRIQAEVKVHKGR